MSTKRFTCALSLACIYASLAGSSAQAQMTKERAKTIGTRLHQLQAAAKKIPAVSQQALSGSSHLLQIAKVWDNLAAQMIKNPVTRPGLSGVTINNLPARIVPVSDPATDLAFSSFSGFTQSETSTARCGNNVVVGFNDSGSVFETGFFSGGGESFSGAAFSTDGGTTFRDAGPIPPGPAPNFLGGDPVVNCSDSSTFYYSQILLTADSSGNPLAAVAVSKSTDGGATWADPVAAVAKDGFSHFLDKDWSTIDPNDTRRIYVSYTDFDFSFSSSACPNDVRSAIEFVQSNDGGATWRRPVILDEKCFASNIQVQGSQLVVDSHSTLHAAWFELPNFPFGNRPILASSFKPGRRPTTPVLVDTVSPPGDSFFLEGEFRDFLGMSMAVDRSGTSSDGNLYVAWGDGRDKIIPDPLGFNGAYSFEDVLARTSFDGGNTWGFSASHVNTDTQPRLGLGHDHYQPGIAVDKTGKVAACWYDRRADAEDFAIGRWCGESTTNGFSWTNANTGLSPFAPTHGIDILINPVYMGDYDQLTTDFTGAHTGFIGAFQSMGNRGNPDVMAFSFQ